MAIAIAYLPIHAQLDSVGNSHVDFSIDGDTRTGFQKFGSQSASLSFHHDDWFFNNNYTGKGQNVIDTTNAAALKAMLQANPNISFIKRMAKAAFDVVFFYNAAGLGPIGARFWVDAVYFRDNAQGLDSTSFTGSKNGNNPNNWTGTIGTVLDKSDIIDVYTHVRTSGIDPVKDSVWFFAGVATVGTNGSRFFDIEVFRENISYDPTTKKFTSLGTSDGHSEWTFDASGNVTQTGDIIISVAYQAGRAPEIDFRIWVHKNTVNNVTPTAFKFDQRIFDLNDAGNAGYAKITSNSGNTNWGTGVANYSSNNNAANDSTYSTPWGTINSVTRTWSEHYAQLQFVEVALNFSRFGMNPFSYVTSFCKSPYASILIKSRTSTEFNSNLADFVGPTQFTVKDLSPYTIATDTVTCLKPTSTIQLSAPARNYYRWFNMNGDTLRKDSDVKTFTPTKAGTYVVEATNFQGCAPMKKDTIVVALDSIPPVAKALLGWERPYYFLNGGDTAASNKITPFGRSTGLEWSWTGPNGFTSNVRDPKIDPENGGMFYLTLKEKRNGCTAMDSIFLSSSAFTLPLKNINLTGNIRYDQHQLKWNAPDIHLNTLFIVERSKDGKHFSTIAQIKSIQGESVYVYTDQDFMKGYNHYRIRSVLYTGLTQLSNIVILQNDNGPQKVIAYRNEKANTIVLEGIETQAEETVVHILQVNGALLMKQRLNAAQNTSRGTTKQTIQLPGYASGQPLIIMLYQDNKLITTKKL
jgi:hypothetical protein